MERGQGRERRRARTGKDDDANLVASRDSSGSDSSAPDDPVVEEMESDSVGQPAENVSKEREQVSEHEATSEEDEGTGS